MEILYLARYKNCKQVFGILRRTMLTQQRCKEPSAYSGRQQHLFSHWYDTDGEHTVKTSGENEAIYVNSEFSGGNTGTARFSLYVSPYLVAGQGGKYTKHIYVGSQRIVSKLGDLASYGADPRRIPYAGNEADGLIINYKDKYNQQLQSIKDNYKAFDQPYNGKDNDDYVNGQGFCCNDGTLEATQAMARTRAANGNFKPNDDYEKMQFYYHPDHLGSSSYITNLDGEVSQHIEYVPFGEVFIEERNNTWNTPYLFNAKEFDEETGLYYYGARYYEPRLSLWMSTDPLEGKYPNISSYCFTANNPIVYIDLKGLDLVKVSVPANKEGTKFRMIEIDSIFADKVYTFTRAMNKKYGVYVISAFRSKTKQLAMRTAWDSGNRKGLKARPGKTSAHSSGFALDFNISSLGLTKQNYKQKPKLVQELTEFAKEYGFEYGAHFKGNVDLVHFYGNETDYGYKSRDEAIEVNDTYKQKYGDNIPNYTPEQKKHKEEQHKKQNTETNKEQ